MICPWKELLAILPGGLRQDVDNLGKESLQELRLRLGEPPELVLGSGIRWLSREVTGDDLKLCLNNATRYSPWNASTIGQGYITAQGGHRIGLCGEAVMKHGMLTGLRELTSVCIRVARDFPGCAKNAAGLSGSVLILGAPGWGKTTLLRDFIRQISDREEHIAVVDERGELFPPGSIFTKGKCTDVLTGCPKHEGIGIVLRTMGPSAIAVDEITAQRDCEALTHALWCGVRVIATAHAESLRDLKSRPVYRPLVETGLFTNVLVMRRDKSWRLERMDI